MQENSLKRNPYLSRLDIAVKRINRTNRKFNFHTHDATELVIVIESGGASHWVNGLSYNLQRGDILLLPPGVVHAYENCSDMHIINVLYQAAQLPLPPLDSSELRMFRHFTAPRICWEHPEKPQVHIREDEMMHIETLSEMLENEINSSNPGKNLCAFGMFITLLIKIIQMGGRTFFDENLSAAARAVTFINLHFTEDISIEKLAKLCNLSRTGFFRHFHEMTGYSPLEYQRKKRLEMAYIMLLKTDLSIGEIAQKCGFCDSNHMTKLFSREYSMPPRQLKLQKKLKATTGTTAKDSIPAAPEPVHQPL